SLVAAKRHTLGFAPYFFDLVQNLGPALAESRTERGIECIHAGTKAVQFATKLRSGFVKLRGEPSGNQSTRDSLAQRFRVHKRVGQGETESLQHFGGAGFDQSAATARQRHGHASE